jgi:hypothetical protein
VGLFEGLSKGVWGGVHRFVSRFYILHFIFYILHLGVGLHLRGLRYLCSSPSYFSLISKKRGGGGTYAFFFCFLEFLLAFHTNVCCMF